MILQNLGRIDGNVTSVSADALSNNQTGEQFYLVDVSMRAPYMKINGDESHYTPRHGASIDVLSGKRTCFRLFLAANIQRRETPPSER
jgi:adhesin transport system membrane fusion protein